MKIEKLFRALTTEAWYIRPEEFKGILQLLPPLLQFFKSGKISISTEALEKIEARIEAQREEKKAYAELDGVAVLEISGVLMLRPDEYEKWLGAIDMEEIEGVLYQMLADEMVSAIVLDIDSPGGIVTGAPELADLVAEVNEKKPIFAFTKSMMASCAYYIAAGASAIYSTKSALVGSIGVYMPLLDVSGLYEKLGLKADLIKVGKYKTAGYPGTSLTDEERAQFQDHVNFAYDQFAKHVRKHRADVPRDAMEGQVFWGAEAIEAGLVDSIADLSKTIQDARNYASADEPTEE